MAITAVMTVSAATVTAEQAVSATCTVSNSGGAAVNVSAIQPTVTPSGSKSQAVSVAVGVPPVGPGLTVSVAAGGSTAFSWGVIPHAPASGEGLAEPAQIVYDLGALVFTSDAARTLATTTTLTVNAP